MKFVKQMLLAVAALALVLVMPQTVKADTSEDGLWEYDANYYEGTCTITGFNGDIENISDFVFPKKVDGLKTTAIKIRFDYVPGKGVSRTVTYGSYQSVGFFVESGFNSITVPEGVKSFEASSIVGNAYVDVYACKLPTSLEELNVEFMGLKELTIPKNVNYAELKCPELEKITFAKGIERVSLEMKLPYGVNYHSLKEVVLPDTVKEISSSAFKNCALLSKINLKNVEVIEEDAFKNCKSLTSVSLNPKKLAIGVEAFMGSGLKKVTIPKCATSLYSPYVNTSFNNTFYQCFKDCEDLTEVTFNSTEAEKLMYTFEGCKNLKKVKLPSGLKGLGFTFENCESLETVVVPASVEECFAFKGATKAKIVFLNPDCIINSSTINRISYTTYFDKKATIYGYKNSTAQDAAKNSGCNFVALTTATKLKAVNTKKETIELTWAAVKGVDSYTVYRSTQKDKGYKKVATVENTKYVDTKATKGKTYYYKVAIDYKDKTGVELKGIMSTAASTKSTK